MNKHHFVSVAACALAVALTTHANAQEVQPTTVQQDSGADEGLGDIVVTAQRREENLQRAAIAVSTVDAEALREASITNPAQLTSVVPALQISPLGASFNYYLRGVGNVSGNPLSESAIAFNFGGVYIGRPASSTAFFYDLERMEVLKGPQGTLYGRNATGGAINVIPAAPTHDFSGDLYAEIGNFESVNLQGMLNVPLTDNAALRFAGFMSQHDGYNEDGTDDQDDHGGRVSFRLEATDDLTISIMADYASIGGNGLGSTPVQLGLENRFGATSPEAQAFYEGQPHAIGGRNFDGMPAISFQDNEFWGLTTTIDWHTEAGTFTFIPAYRESDIASQSASAGFMVSEWSSTAETSFEARYASDEDNRLRTLLGAYFYNADTDVPLFMVNNQYDYVHTLFTHETESQAVFGRLTYDITPDFRANVGLRYTHEEKRLNGDNLTLDRICLAGFLQCPDATPFPYGTTALPSFTELPDGTIVPEFNAAEGILQVGTRILVEDEASFNRLTWRAGLDWDVTSRNLLYASFETGFKSGGFFFTHDRGVYEPETIEAFTIGSKNRFFDNRVQLNLEAFVWTYEDQQVSHVALDSFGTAVFVTENVGQATMQGIEADIQYLLTPDTLLSADFQYLDANYDQFTYLFPNLGAPPATTCPAVLNGGNYTIDCGGQRPPMAPEWTLNLGVEQTFSFANTGELVLVGRMHYQTETLTSLEFLPEEFQDGYATFDASATYHAPGDRFTIGAFVNNLTDETVMGGSFIPPFAATNFAVGILRPPRTFGVRLGASF